jgi:hypothetical protein
VDGGVRAVTQRAAISAKSSVIPITLVSSFGAAREGALLADVPKSDLGPEAEAYRKLLQRVVGDLRDSQGGHPKVDHVVHDALAAAERGEKTLIFCTRIQTLHELKREMEAIWNEKMSPRGNVSTQGPPLLTSSTTSRTNLALAVGIRDYRRASNAGRTCSTSHFENGILRPCSMPATSQRPTSLPSSARPTRSCRTSGSQRYSIDTSTNPSTACIG